MIRVALQALCHMDRVRRNASDVGSGWPDRAIAAIAGRQRCVINRAQLLALGISPSAIKRAVARGRLHRIHRGVYALVPVSALPPLAREQAALLACGDGAVLSHLTAARLHGIAPASDGPVHLTVAGTRRRSRLTGVRVHRTVALHPADRHRIARLPVTASARTLIDVAPGLPDRALQRATDQTLKRTSRARLAEALARHPGRPGTPRLRALLAGESPSTDTWSHAEERLLRLIRRSGLPSPETNVALGGYVPDLLWRDQRVIVEFDSVAHHAQPGAFHHDRHRHNELTTAGYRVLHVTWPQLTGRPEQVLVWIATALTLATRP